MSFVKIVAAVNRSTTAYIPVDTREYQNVFFAELIHRSETWQSIPLATAGSHWLSVKISFHPSVAHRWVESQLPVAEVPFASTQEKH